MSGLRSSAGDTRSVVAPDAGGHSAGRHVGQHDRIGADPRVITDGHRSEHLGPGTDSHVVADAGLAIPFAGVSEGHPLVDDEVVTRFHLMADDDAHGVDDGEAGTDAGIGVDFDSGRTDAARL